MGTWPPLPGTVAAATPRSPATRPHPESPSPPAPTPAASSRSSQPCRIRQRAKTQLTIHAQPFPCLADQREGFLQRPLADGPARAHRRTVGPAHTSFSAATTPAACRIPEHPAPASTFLLLPPLQALSQIPNCLFRISRAVHQVRIRLAPHARSRRRTRPLLHFSHPIQNGLPEFA